MARAVEWSSRVTSIAAGMVVPAALGYWLDEKLGIKGVFLVLGVVLGLASGLWQLFRLAGAETRKQGRPAPSDKQKHEDDDRGNGRDPWDRG